MQSFRIEVEDEFGQGETGKVETVAAILCDIISTWRDCPGPWVFEPSARQHQDADDVGLEHEDMGCIAMVAGERQVARLARGQVEPRGRRQIHQLCIVPSSSRLIGRLAGR